MSCYVELKIDKFRHEYASQLNMYLNYFKAEVMQPDDNPPIGILLCTEKGDTLVKYATAGLDPNIFVQKYRIELPTEEEIKAIYQAKTEEFNKCPMAERMPGAYEVLTKIKEEGLIPMVVTGSGQTSLLDRLNHNFPGIFQANLMVTAFDVKYGKPNPEPYLMALKKGGFKPNEALVIENAPLGVQAGVAAGIFTIAVNTGPLHDNVLLNEGANLLFHSMPDFNRKLGKH